MQPKILIQKNNVEVIYPIGIEFFRDLKDPVFLVDENLEAELTKNKIKTEHITHLTYHSSPSQENFEDLQQLLKIFIYIRHLRVLYIPNRISFIFFKILPSTLKNLELEINSSASLKALAETLLYVPATLKTIVVKELNVPASSPFPATTKEQCFSCIEALPSHKIEFIMRKSKNADTYAQGEFEIIAANYGEGAEEWNNYKLKKLTEAVKSHIQTNERRQLFEKFVYDDLLQNALEQKNTSLSLLTLAMIEHDYYKFELSTQQQCILRAIDYYRSAHTKAREELETASTHLKELIVEVKNEYSPSQLKLFMDKFYPSWEKNLFNKESFIFSSFTTAMDEYLQQAQPPIIKKNKSIQQDFPVGEKLDILHREYDLNLRISDFCNFALWEIKIIYSDIHEVASKLKNSNVTPISLIASYSCFKPAPNSEAQEDLSQNNVFKKA